MHNQAEHWQEWQTAFGDWTGFGHPAELHGLVTGVVCVAAPPNRAGWQALLAGLEVEAADDDGGWRLLEDEGQDLSAALAEDNLDFEPLLPDDDQPLWLRVQALGAWCSGLLLGFALAGGQVRADENDLINDVQDIGQMDWEGQADDEDGENDYADLLEFVRLVPVSLSMGRNKPAAAKTALVVDTMAPRPS